MLGQVFNTPIGDLVRRSRDDLCEYRDYGHGSGGHPKMNGFPINTPAEETILKDRSKRSNTEDEA